MSNEPVTARIAPLQPPYAPETEEMLRRWMPPGSAVEPLALFRTLAVHEGLASRMRPLGAGILGRSALVDPQVREVVIQRTCALARNGYEWGVHAVAFGPPLGLDEHQARSTALGSARDGCWSPAQAAAFRLADELHESCELSEDLWEQLSAHFQEAQILELLATAGWYRLISYICNAARVQPEPWGAQLPVS